MTGWLQFELSVLRAHRFETSVESLAREKMVHLSVCLTVLAGIGPKIKKTPGGVFFI